MKPPAKLIQGVMEQPWPVAGFQRHASIPCQPAPQLAGADLVRLELSDVSALSQAPSLDSVPLRFMPWRIHSRMGDCRVVGMSRFLLMISTCSGRGGRAVADRKPGPIQSCS